MKTGDFMVNNFKELPSSSIFVFAFFLASNINFAHFNSAVSIKNNLIQNDDFTSKHSKDLKNYIGLRNDQTSKVGNILIDYRYNVLNNNKNISGLSNSIDLQQTANNSIIKLLDESQKAAFAQIEKEWWTNVNQEISTVNI
jgi:hypothetical protein